MYYCFLCEFIIIYMRPLIWLKESTNIRLIWVQAMRLVQQCITIHIEILTSRVCTTGPHTIPEIMKRQKDSLFSNCFFMIFKPDCLFLDLQPRDNAYYACQAFSGTRWKAFFPVNDAPGRLTVWFGPSNLLPMNANVTEHAFNNNSVEPLYGSAHGLAHTPSRLWCQVLGQPPPAWKWYGPQTGNEVLANEHGTQQQG